MGTNAVQGRKDSWTIQELLVWTTDYFASKGLDSPRLDAEVLLSASLGCDRIYLYTHFDKPLSASEREGFRAWVKRRAAREPVAYILGRKEFFSREFRVGPEVLVPRPESEHLVESALAWLDEQKITAPRILDIGTGSGCLAISLACERPDASVVATDVSEAALALARANAREHLAEGPGASAIEFVLGNLFEPLAGCEAFDVIVSNPPYIATGERAGLDADVRDFEPEQALFAGHDGLAVIKPLLAQARRFLKRPGLLLCEHGHDQHDALVALCESGWREVGCIKDLAGHRRALLAVV